MSRGTKQLRLAKQMQLRQREVKGLDFAKIEERKKAAKQKREEVEALIDAATTDEELEAASAAAETLEEEEAKIKEDEEALKQKKQELEDTIAEIQEEIDSIQDLGEKRGGQMKKVERNKGDKFLEQRKAADVYIRTKGQVRADELNGFKSIDGEVLIPVDRVTKPERQKVTIVRLSDYVKKVKVKTASGTYPIMKRTDAKLLTVEELEKNPKLAKPEFFKVDYKIKTYRGSIAISQEAIDDADSDLVGLVEEHVSYMEVNTENAEIGTVLKSFTKKTVATVDDIKKIVNIDLDPAYPILFIMSQSFYQLIDELKDKNGRYLFQDSITSPSGHTFLGRPAITVRDMDLGTAGKANMFIGDMESACTLFDRKELGIKWVDNEIYGEYLRGGKRMDIKKVDENAGFFVSADSLSVVVPETPQT